MFKGSFIKNCSKRRYSPTTKNSLVLLSISYGQFVNAVAQGRNLPIEEVKAFSDGRVFTGEQALKLGLVDKIGDENEARLTAAELADIDKNMQPITLERPKKKLLGLLPGGQILIKFFEILSMEISTNGQVLWLFKS